MKEKAVTRVKMSWSTLLSSDLFQKIAVHMACFALGLLYSRGIVFGKYAPFGVAAVAAVPYRNLWSTVLGSIIGYLIPSDSQIPARYLATVLAVAAIRWTLSDLMKLRSHLWFAPLVAGIPMLATGIALSWVNGTTTAGVTLYIAESVLAAGSSYFIFRTSQVLESGRRLAALKQQEMACLIVAVGILILSLDGITIGSISIGHVAAILAILLAARYGGVAGGSICGIAAGVALSLSSAGLNYLSGAYALGGLMAGIFIPVGRLASVVAFILSNAIASLQVGNQEAVIVGLYEVAAATIIYIFWPVSDRMKLSSAFSPVTDLQYSDALRRSVIMKMDYASSALSNVSESVEKVSEKLAKICAPDIGGVYRQAMDETCRRCGLKVYCWERGYDDSMRALNDLTQPLRQKGYIEKSDFQPEFAEHCSRITEFSAAINRRYNEFLAREVAERRVAQIRSVVADQFGTTSELLRNMAQELELYERFDFSAAQRVTSILLETGIMPLDVACRIDRFNRMTIEAEAVPDKGVHLNRAALAKQISRACNRHFDFPCVSSAEGKYRIQMSERPVYRMKKGFAQHVCGNAQLCGDSFESFLDGSGHQVTIISDGMGTGGRAAVDGAMAAGITATLLKAGIGFDCALKIVNSALLAKSGDESLATLDVVSVDLFSGEAEFLKSGAPVSFVCRSGKAERVEAESLPIGILNEAGFARKTMELEDGDFIVQVSDGVVASGDEWILRMIESWEEEDLQELASKLVEQAKIRRNDGHDDDITALVMQLSSARGSDQYIEAEE